MGRSPRAAVRRLGGYPYGGYTGTGASGNTGTAGKANTGNTNTASKVGTSGKKDDKKATGKDLKNRAAKKKGCC